MYSDIALLFVYLCLLLLYIIYSVSSAEYPAFYRNKNHLICNIF